MIRLESNKMQNAIARAKTIRPRVRRTGERSYSVTSSTGQTAYTVRFVVANGLRLGECTCKAGQSNQVCFHIAAAAALNIAIHSNYSKPSDAPEASHPHAGVLIKPEGRSMRIGAWEV